MDFAALGSAGAAGIKGSIMPEPKRRLRAKQRLQRLSRIKLALSETVTPDEVLRWLHHYCKDTHLADGVHSACKRLQRMLA